MIFKNTYQNLPKLFYSNSTPANFPNPQLLKFNQDLSNALGLKLNTHDEKELVLIFSGQKILESSHPIALAYAGHQFGHFVPQLGDGRALLLGEVLDPNGKRFDIQLKGSGQTVFSRNGDGKSSLGPVIREYILSEAMHHLGVPTTRALAAVSTGELIYRETPMPGAVLTRVASSHLRIGTFQYAAARKDIEGLKSLLNYAIDRHYPEIKNETNSPILFLQKVSERQTSLIAHWMSLGFIHGVMNTDNMSISGETIDFGPCAFMDYFNFDQVYSFIDRNGRYAYKNQGSIALWNLSRLADCLIPLIDSNEKTAIEKLNVELSQLPKILEVKFNERMASKLGLPLYEDGDEKILKKWFEYLQTEKLDFTLSFRNLSELIETNKHEFFKPTNLFKEFLEPWKTRIKNIDSIKTNMNSINPLFIPRNHNVEVAIQKAVTGDLSILHELNDVLSKPFTEQSQYLHYSHPPKENEIVQNTFCGT